MTLIAFVAIGVAFLEIGFYVFLFALVDADVLLYPGFFRDANIDEPGFLHDTGGRVE